MNETETTGILVQLLQILIPPIIEYRFGIIGRLKKSYYWIINKNAGFEICLVFNKIENFENIKNKFIDIVRTKYGTANQKRNGPSILEVVIDNYLTTLNYGPDGELIISTTRIECGVRNLKDKLTDFLGLIDNLVFV